jgi:hypothetical protein
MHDYDYTFDCADLEGDELIVRGYDAPGHGLMFAVNDMRSNTCVEVHVEEAKRLRDLLDAYIENNEPRTYVVGLPVIVTVRTDGTVEYEVDTAEAGREVSEHYEEPRPGDVERVEADHERRRRTSE